METGLPEAAKWGNKEVFNFLIRQKACSIPTDLLQQIMKRAIESDCNETVKIVKTLFNEGHYDVPEDVLDVARERGIYSIMITLGILTMSEEEIERKEEEIRENIKNGVALVSSNKCTDLHKISTFHIEFTGRIPKSVEFGYNGVETNARIVSFLSAEDGETIEVPFEILLQFHLPDVHYELDRQNDNTLGRLKRCPSDCKTKEMCGVM